jgi:hypothetical protein
MLAHKAADYAKIDETGSNSSNLHGAVQYGLSREVISPHGQGRAGKQAPERHKGKWPS